jgi:hypothetical protein
MRSEERPVLFLDFGTLGKRVMGDLMGGVDTGSNGDDRWQQTTRGRHVHEKGEIKFFFQ